MACMSEADNNIFNSLTYIFGIIPNGLHQQNMFFVEDFYIENLLQFIVYSLYFI